MYGQKLSSDDLSNCVACEMDSEVSFNIYGGKDEQALNLASPLLDGWRKCRAVPQRTLAYILLPLLRLGREKEARAYQRRGYAMIDDHREFLDHMSHHLLFLTLMGNLKEATRLLEKHYHWSEENTDLYDQFLFYRAAWLLLETMIEMCTNNIKLRLPDSFPLASEDGHYQTSQLSEWFETRARSLASRFDERNGNDYFTRELLDMAALKELRARE